MNDKSVRALIHDDEVAIVAKPRRNVFGKVIYYILGALVSLTFLMPILYMFAASTKSQEVIDQHAGTIMMFIPNFANMGNFFGNYHEILFGQYSILRNALNSLIYASIVIVLNILINGLAAYAICKLRFPGKRFFNFIIMFLIIVPVETSIIPLFSICKTMLGMNDNWSVLAIVLPPTISIFNIFLFIQFFSSIPVAYEEAARMDGANTLQIFFKVILPLSKPILATVAVFCFIGVWNDYLWPTMVMTNQDMWPIQAELESIARDDNLEPGHVMASLVLTSLPIFIIYIAAQKYIVKGFGAGGLKL